MWRVLALIGLVAVLADRGRASRGAVDAGAVARAELARLGRWRPEDLTVRASRPHVFADSCLGLAAPGEVCAQAATPGYLVELEAAGRVFELHVAGDRARFCPPCSQRLTAEARSWST